ncbi:DUF4852 domain-containing protein [Bremerella alba]|uniref:SLA1 homology domain-containing protein n=1 Tax=Bremerella alba TaxID=980252 RepID=A0A7V8V3I1_9BACT|nr:DUF4852 domain-containing protein [Bremerella alba]MBA2114101.1 hypothetical protein [Bremerella alba]
MLAYTLFNSTSIPIRNLSYFAAVLLLITPSLSIAESRVWTTSDGKQKAVAECYGTDGELVVLKFEANGRVAKVHLEDLCAADQEYLRKTYRRVFAENAQQAAKSPKTKTQPFKTELDTTTWQQFKRIFPEWKPLMINGVPVIGDLKVVPNSRDGYYDISFAQNQIAELMIYFTDRKCFKKLSARFKERGRSGAFRSGEEEERQAMSLASSQLEALYEYSHFLDEYAEFKSASRGTEDDFKRGELEAKCVDFMDGHLSKISETKELPLVFINSASLSTYDFDNQYFPLNTSTYRVPMGIIQGVSHVLNLEPLSDWQLPEGLKVDAAKAREIAKRMEDGSIVLKQEIILSDFRRTDYEDLSKKGNYPCASVRLTGLTLVLAKDLHTEIYRWDVDELKSPEKE